MINKVGSNIKKLRKEKGITLQELSNKTNLSTGFLSQLERDINSPTIINLQKICNALNINMTDLLSTLDTDKIHVKRNDRRVIFETNSNIRYELTSEGNRALKGVCMIVDDNSNINQSFKHNSDEFGIVIKGCLELTIDNTSYILEKGDSIYIKANTEHSFRKLSEGECVSYWTYHANNDNIGLVW